MNVRVNADWNTLDPALIGTTPAIQLVPVLYDRLVARDASGKVVPYLAESWKVVSPQQITFKIKSGVTCSDGSALTATGVANSLTRLFDPATKSALLVGAFSAGQTYKVAADDASSTVTVDFGTPAADALYGFAHPATGIVCAAGLENPASLGNQSSGTGPYVLKEATHGKSVTVERRKGWNWGPSWSKSAPASSPDEMVFKVITNETTAANLLLSGGLDFASINASDVPRLKADKTLTDYTFTNKTPWQLLVNEAPGRPGADPAVRQALFLTIDRKDFMAVAFAGLGTPSDSLLMPGIECYDDSVAALAPKQNLEKAKSVLLAAGYTVGANGKFQKNGVPLKVALLGSNAQGNGPDYILNQFMTLGVDASLSMVDQSAQNTNMRAGNFDAVIGSTGQTVPTGSMLSIYGTPAPAGGPNFASVSDPAIDKAMPLALGTVGPERCQYWSAVQKALIQGNHWYGLAAPESYWFGKDVSATVQTIQSNGIDYGTLAWK